MLSKVRRYIKENNLICENDSIICGISGGADSVCLFIILEKLKAEMGLKIVPVHVHHQIRGDEADRDEKFTGKLTEKYGEKLVSCHVDVPAMAEELHLTLEEAGRKARYDTFKRIADEYGCNKTAVAHHINDQAETVLFNLFRGSRLKGMSGMKPKSDEIIRPLLCVTREEIERYLNENGIGFCVDSTNLTTDYTRNRIRHIILPEAEKVHAGAVGHIAETAAELGEISSFFEDYCERVYKKAVNGEKYVRNIAVDVLSEEKDVVRREVIYKAICELAGAKKDITSDYVYAVNGLMSKQTGKRIMLGMGVTAERIYKEIRICTGKKEKEENSRYNENVDLPIFIDEEKIKDGYAEYFLGKEYGWLKVSVEKRNPSEAVPKNNYTKWFDYAKIKDRICIRHKEENDNIVLYSDGRGKNLNSLFVDKKINKNARGTIPLLAVNNQIIWAIGVRGSEAYHITENTEYVLKTEIYGGFQNG